MQVRVYRPLRPPRPEVRKLLADGGLRFGHCRGVLGSISGLCSRYRDLRGVI
jgi:hypothetical protein